MSAVEVFQLQDVLKKLKDAGPKLEPNRCTIEANEAKWLIRTVQPIFKEQGMLAEVRAPVSICGDIHGQYADLLRLFESHGWPPKSNYLFLGDYVDRGPNSVQTILLLFSLKVAFPKRFHLLRGNHETRDVNYVYGFKDEVSAVFPSTSVYAKFNEVFGWMPLSGLVAKRILCMHGGISPELKNLDQIRNLVPPIEKPTLDEGIVCDLLWADPDKNASGFVPSTRGISYTFGADAVMDAIETLGIDMIARAHQVVLDGFEFFANDHLVTLFSAPDYCGQYANAGGILVVAADLNCKVKQIPSKYAVKRKQK